MQIDAILSDYDGTLCPTMSINSKESPIPKELENVLWCISEVIPVCIISSKDFNFLHRRTKFASIASCIMGIETLVLRRHDVITDLSEDVGTGESVIGSGCQNRGCIKESYIRDENGILQHNSHLLYQIAEFARTNFDEIQVEQKYTATGRKVLAGITLDWRDASDWKRFRIDSEPRLQKIITQKQSELGSKQPNIYIQNYSTHPFIDVYSTPCDKGMAYDQIISMIQTPLKRRWNTIYLGDSENDNPGFRKATVSIGVRSDIRLNPKLDCNYNLHISKLSIFLQKLLANNLKFSSNLITS